MNDPIQPSLRDFAETWTHRDAERPAWAHPHGPPLHLLDDLHLRRRLEDVLDTVVALQRAEWLQDGLYVGPRAMPELYRDLLDAARRLRIGVPPAIVGSGSAQGVLGTDARAYLHLSSGFVGAAGPAERQFAIGRACGHIRAGQVTWNTLYALLVDEGGARRLARRAVGPALDVLLAPLTLGARLALSRWHRAAEITADRAGMLCVGDADAARRALLRRALGDLPGISPDDYLDQLREPHGASSPGRFSEILSARPWLHKRLAALSLFSRSAPWVDAGFAPTGEILSADALAQQTERLLGVR